MVMHFAYPGLHTYYNSHLILILQYVTGKIASAPGMYYLQFNVPT